MKHLLRTFLLLAIISPTYAYDFKVGELYYNITSNSEPYTVEVTYEKYNSSENYSTLRTLSVPSSVTDNGVTYIVTCIGDCAFWQCKALSSVTLSNNIKNIGDHSFASCTDLQSIILSDSLLSLGAYAFDACWDLASITLPNNITKIGEGTFHGCALMSIDIPHSVISIGRRAFEATGIYRDVSNWEEEVLYINDCLIEASKSISNTYVIKDGTRIIADDSFSFNSNLKSITIPNSVTDIGASAFNSCSSLSSVVIPQGVRRIWNGAFAFCSSLDSINMLDGVTSIGASSFVFCTSLTSITLPSSIKHIEAGAFGSCTALKSVEMQKGIESIGQGAFSLCYSLNSVTCKAIEIPQIDTNVFIYSSQTSATLYVPSLSLKKYKSAEQWRDFGTILPIEGTDVENIHTNSTCTNKILKNNQLIILRDGKTYDMLGKEL